MPVWIPPASFPLRTPETLANLLLEVGELVEGLKCAEVQQRVDNATVQTIRSSLISCHAELVAQIARGGPSALEVCFLVTIKIYFGDTLIF